MKFKTILLESNYEEIKNTVNNVINDLIKNKQLNKFINKSLFKISQKIYVYKKHYGIVIPIKENIGTELITKYINYIKNNILSQYNIKCKIKYKEGDKILKILF